MKETFFSPADMLLPPYTPDDPAWCKWSVIACDQFTSEKQYWDSVAKITEGAPSAYSLILPEAYLGSEAEEVHKKTIAASMDTVGTFLKKYENVMVYVERTLEGAGVRRGLVGKLDLEKYDYSASSISPVRATEATVLERIPPRCRIRASSPFELPHVMVFADDKGGIISSLASRKNEMKKLYDFDLMLGGGHIAGYLVSGEVLEFVAASIAKYESSFGGTSPVVYAVGDGNHSLAAAKAHWENVRASGCPAARYALCEIVDISEPSIEFEPIYRIVKNCNVPDFLSALEALSGDGEQKVTALYGGCEKEFSFAAPTHALTVGTLQNFIDSYIEAHPGAECDYIHGTDSLRVLSAEKDCVGFIFDGMSKDELFPYVTEHGVLPRKTFSMGDAHSKRYYTEVRGIV